MENVSDTAENFEEAVVKYHDGVIGRKGKTQLLQEYSLRFPENGSHDTLQRLVRKEPDKRIRVPTMEEEAWIIDTVNRYWKQYNKFNRVAIV
ncbi:hypothetical protein BWI93_10110 [Siphonobacter sp. BAB-5385]|uniref:hypothetical protein n=1 Tax=Siphonobacter sp. BAB-5385 TaxID=1864822 RepID=UPI000B9E7BF8|nr:hypothetical protein [Siphonobacter sp. BAB-5385]OZI08213.1 hypothetical protein BWI93_10110 [Siphonobacter sp. BAB-5385]